MKLQRHLCISVLLIFSFAVVNAFFAPTAAAQSISVGSWSFEQKIERNTGSVVACRTNAPVGDYADLDREMPLLRAQAEVKVSSVPRSHCRIAVEAEALLTVYDEDTRVTIHCENRGRTVLQGGSLSATGGVLLDNETGLANLQFANCNAPSPTPMGTHNVIEMQDRSICLTPGDYKIRGKLVAEAQIGVGATFDTADANFIDRVPAMGLKVWATSAGACETPRSFSSITGFDQNDNKFIDDDEFFKIVDAWIAGELSNELFFKAVDFWITLTPINARRVFEVGVASPIELGTYRSGNAMSFIASGQNVSRMAVSVYGLNGVELYSQNVSGSNLRWNMLGSDGNPLANGIYLVQMSALDSDGRILKEEIEKILILR